MRRYHAEFETDWEESEARLGYVSLVRRPLPNLVFILPLVLVYEGGVVGFGSESSAAPRAGIDFWIRDALAFLGPGVDFALPGLLCGVLAAWMLVDGPRSWRFRATWLAGMVVESVAIGAVLIGVSRILDLGLLWLDGQPIWLASAANDPQVVGGAGMWLGLLGAGLYEEAVFRLALLPVLYWLMRIVQAPDLLAGTIAVTGSALAFSIAHHAGVPGEAFTWFVFLFRWLAGIVFAWVFLVRGFGIAVGSHVAYDVLVGYADWGG